MTKPTRLLFSTAALALTAAGCGDDAVSEGEVTVTAYGESFIEDEIPADEVVDGWRITFDQFYVEIEDVQVGGQDIEIAEPIDLSQGTDGAGHIAGSATVPAGDHTDASYTISRVWLNGAAYRDDGAGKLFSWTFDTPTRYTGCETTTSVEDGGTATFEITVHADHLFYDSLVADEPNLMFQALADADADLDGNITQEELAATDIGAYDPGSAGDVDNLWDWLVAQSATLGHVDGEGHCDAQALSN